MSSYDLISDIHGHAGELKALLARMGYVDREGAWRHPSRKGHPLVAYRYDGELELTPANFVASR